MTWLVLITIVFSSDENVKSITVRKFRQIIALEKLIHLGSLQTFHAVLLSSISEMGAGTRTPQRLRLSLSRHDLESIFSVCRMIQTVCIWFIALLLIKYAKIAWITFMLNFCDSAMFCYIKTRRWIDSQVYVGWPWSISVAILWYEKSEQTISNEKECYQYVLELKCRPIPRVLRTVLT